MAIFIGILIKTGHFLKHSLSFTLSAFSVVPVQKCKPINIIFNPNRHFKVGLSKNQFMKNCPVLIRNQPVKRDKITLEFIDYPYIRRF